MIEQRILTKFILILIVSASMVTGCSSSKSVKKSTSSASFFQKSSSNKHLNVTGNVRKRFQIALVLMEDGELDKAANILIELAEKNPQLSGVYLNLGIISVKRNDFLEAERFMLNAKQANPSNVEAYNYLGFVYRQQGRFLEAEKAYKQALLIDNKHVNSHLNLGILNDLYLSRYREARKYYENYLSFKPGDKKVEAWLRDLDLRTSASLE